MFELDLTRVDYTWQPAGESQPNTFTAQNIFKSPSATVAGGVFQSSGTISAIPAGYGGSNIVAQFLAEESSAFPYTLFEATGNAQGHILALRSSRGTYSARTAVQSGDILGQLDFGGHNSSALVNGKASIRAVSAQTWTTTANGTNLEFYATQSGTTSAVRVGYMEGIGGAGQLVVNNSFYVIGTNPFSRLSSASGNTRNLSFETTFSPRWRVLANATAEGGSNAGSDFEIRRYSDAGADLGAVISINRANGGTVFANNVTFSTQASVDGAAGTNRLLLYRTSGSNRWAIFADSGSETGTGNAGSFLNIARYNDAGGFIDSPILISRSTGKVTFAANAINIATTQSPPSGTSGTTGDLAWDDTYLYGRTSTGWKRIAWVAY